MRLLSSVRLGAWILIGLNFLMALACVHVFTRMAPAIEIIIEQNEKSLKACEEMLSYLALSTTAGQDASEILELFRDALNRAQNNITEPEEPDLLKTISETHVAAMAGDPLSRRRAISAITGLASVNRQAMIQEDLNAQQVGKSGAWGVVFMAICMFLAGLLFYRSLVKKVITPIEELLSVVEAHEKGEFMRRCTGYDLPREVRLIFDGVNTLLDTCR